MAKERGGNNKSLKQGNKTSILRKLFSDGAMSRIALAKELKLTGASISLLTKELFDEGLLEESGERLQRNTSGRKEVIIDIAYDSFIAYNINIESDKIHFAVCTPQRVVKEDIRPTSELIESSDKEGYLIDRIERLNTGAQVIGIGIGISGFVDKSGVLFNTYGIFEKNYNLKEQLEKRTALPVYISNNVRAQAKAIIDNGNKDFMYIKHGPGLGAAIINGGHILTGADNLAGEIGHTVVEQEGELCRCGKRGCLELYLSEKRMLNNYTQKLGGFMGDIKDFYAQYGVENIATEIINDSITRLVNSIGNAIALINPSSIIVAGGLFDNIKLFEAVDKKLKNLSINISFRHLTGKYNIKSIAGARLVFENILFNQD
ncbi:MAG: ROK family protein [Clostridia bacterium]|nr:ROK family protein [Clostridia bacterium]